MGCMSVIKCNKKLTSLGLSALLTLGIFAGEITPAFAAPDSITVVALNNLQVDVSEKFYLATVPGQRGSFSVDLINDGPESELSVALSYNDNHRGDFLNSIQFQNLNGEWQSAASNPVLANVKFQDKETQTINVIWRIDPTVRDNFYYNGEVKLFLNITATSDAKLPEKEKVQPTPTPTPTPTKSASIDDDDLLPEEVETEEHPDSGFWASAAETVGNVIENVGTFFTTAASTVADAVTTAGKAVVNFVANVGNSVLNVAKSVTTAIAQSFSKSFAEHPVTTSISSTAVAGGLVVLFLFLFSRRKQQCQLVDDEGNQCPVKLSRKERDQYLIHEDESTGEKTEIYLCKEHHKIALSDESFMENNFSESNDTDSRMKAFLEKTKNDIQSLKNEVANKRQKNSKTSPESNQTEPAEHSENEE